MVMPTPEDIRRKERQVRQELTEALQRGLVMDPLPESLTRQPKIFCCSYLANKQP